MDAQESVTPGTMMGPGGSTRARRCGRPRSRHGQVTGPQNYMSSYQALALETVMTPMGTFTNALHVHELRGSGYSRDVWYAHGVGMVRWMDASEEAVLARVTMPTGPVPAVARAVEYFHSGLHHYFMTADATEIDALDNGTLHRLAANRG